MATSNFNVRMDNELRLQATQIFASYGLSPTQAVKLFFNQVAATNKIPLNFDYQSEEPTPKLMKAIVEAENGDETSYKNLDDFVEAFK